MELIDRRRRELHRPQTAEGIRAAALDLRARDFTDLAIASAIGVAVEQVRVLVGPRALRPAA